MDEETVNHNQRYPWENERVQKQKFPVVLSMRPDSCHIILNGSRGPRRRRTDSRYQPVTLRSYGNPREGRSLPNTERSYTYTTSANLFMFLFPFSNLYCVTRGFYCVLVNNFSCLSVKVKPPSSPNAGVIHAATHRTLGDSHYIPGLEYRKVS